jgi:hypothetical protein
VKIAALGKPIEVHSDDEMAGYEEPKPTVSVGDVAESAGKSTPPTLKLPDEAQTPTADPTEGTTMRKVQMPTPKTTPTSDPNPDPTAPATPDPITPNPRFAATPASK